jgi:hypothetical protein
MQNPHGISPGKGDTDRESKEKTPLRESEMKSLAASNNKVNDENGFGINGDYE